MEKLEGEPRIIRLEEAVSTNLSLRERLGEGRCSLPERSVVWADYQTAGRGQKGNAWESERGKNLTFSTVLYPDTVPANRQFLLSQVAALSVKETLEAYTGGITVKWPNDIYWDDRKICGMLIENDLSGDGICYSIIGTGINLNQTVFTGNAPNPVSLAQITGRTYDREEILHLCLSCLHRNYLLLLQGKYGEIRSAYHSALYRNKGFHAYRDAAGCFEAAIETVEPDGRLLLRLRNGRVRSYLFKEVGYE